MRREELLAYLEGLLEPARYRDYCPNGLQVEGRAELRRIVCGVTASLALIEAAIAREADAILVHHGWFWKNEDGRVIGYRKRRLQALLAHEINLIAYHLPLDAHAEFGNNAQLAKRLGWTVTGRFAEQEIGFLGTPSSPLPAREIAAQVGAVLGRAPLLVGDEERLVSKIAWCSGGAQGYFEAAIAAGAELFMSGEISEPTVHLSRESGVPYLAAGHHATERFGVMALGEHLAAHCGLECEFVEIDNPA
ncbi:MAG: Nif3-like dinuclear metal center hexameric protein [Rhodocyclaceae bacterium]|nr:Nif3-like dinuclear metal center hexameric protein [Rhodocyclaceae bacterium]